MKIGNSEIEKLYIGEDEVDKLYLGTDLIYEKGSGPDYRTMPLTFEILSGGNIVWKATNTANTVTLEYSKNGGEWTSITSNTGTSAPTITVESGDKVQFRGNNATLATNTSSYNTFDGTTCTANLSGNIMSLLNKDNFATATTLQTTYTFFNLFRYCTGLTDASKLVLPATTLVSSCYRNMFYGCTSLTTAPELPATTLAFGCYREMFNNCTSLTTAPELPATTLAKECYLYMFSNTNVLPDCSNIDFTSATVVASGGLRGLFTNTKVTDNDLRQILPVNPLTNNYYLPATTLASNCYREMFQNCTSLTTAPELPATTLAGDCYSYMFSNCTSLSTAPALPATTLASSCYRSMFYNCTSLTTAPVLPATTLASSCYYGMFQNCTGLTTAPELPATTLASSCYRSMFLSCTSLNYIKCLATDMSASNCTTDWVSGVASRGTFVKAAGVNWSEGTSGIPTGWTIQDNV